MVRKIKFGNRWYTWFYGYSMKKSALNQARKLRDTNFLARVVQEGDSFSVYYASKSTWK